MKKFVSIFTVLVLLATAVVVLNPNVSANETIHFTATDGQTYGDAKSWYSMDAVTKFLNLPGDAYSITYYLNDELLDTGPNSENYETNYGVGGFRYSVKKLPNGLYKLKAVVNTPSQKITAKTWNGAEYLSFNVDNTTKPTAYFAAPDGGQYGNAVDWSPRKLITGFIDLSNGVANIDYLIDGQLVASNTNVDTSTVPRIDFDVSNLTNGPHKLVAVLRNKDGAEGNAKTWQNTEYLSFTVNNKAPTAGDKTIAESEITKRCASKQVAISDITTSILRSTSSQIEIIQSVVVNLNEYYSTQGITTEDYLKLFDSLKEDEKAAQLSLIDLVEKSAVTCKEDGTVDMTEFKKQANSTFDAVAKYRNQTVELIKSLEAL